MPGALLSDAEHRFKADFSQVRVHADSSAGSAAEAVGARAFTLGNDIVFNRGEWAPTNRRGRLLLEHELAHVVQQHSDRGARSGGSSTDLERDASQAADAMCIGRPPRVARASGLVLARTPMDGPAGKKQASEPVAAVPMFEYVDENGEHRRVSEAEGLELRARAVKRMQSALSRVQGTAETWRSSHMEYLDQWHAESFGDLWDKPSRIIGVAANIRAGVVPPTLGIWHHPLHVVDEARKELTAGRVGEAARLLRLAETLLKDARSDWNTFIQASIGGAEKLQGELETVRDTSFAIAIAAGAIVAAPVVAAAVGGAGLTGLAGTGATALGNRSRIHGGAGLCCEEPPTPPRRR